VGESLRQCFVAIHPLIVIIAHHTIRFITATLHHQYKQLKKMEKNKITLHLVLTAPPETIFRAFSDADAYASWLPPNGFVCKVHQMDFEVGGTYNMSFYEFQHGQWQRWRQTQASDPKANLG